MRDRDVFVIHPAIGVLGRLVFTLIFFLAGVTHFTDVRSYAALMPPGTPYAPFWVMLSAVVELLGASMILFDRWPRLGGWLIALFLVPVTITVHGWLMLHAPDEANRQAQLSFFLKGITMTGAALLITQLGVTRGASEDPMPDR